MIRFEENRVVHGHLKPENIFMHGATDEMKMMDFGLALKIHYELWDLFRGEESRNSNTFVKCLFSRRKYCLLFQSKSVLTLSRENYDRQLKKDDLQLGRRTGSVT